MKREIIHILLFITLVVCVFFYPVFKEFMPFPGDLLVSSHQPYKSYSFLGYAPGGVPNKAQGSDVIRMLYPFRWFTIEQIKHFQLPLWNPYTLSGNVHAANLQSAAYYPFNFLFFVLPFPAAWTMLIMLQPLLAAFFLYLFLKESDVGKEGALFGGIIFAFSAFMTVWLQYGNLGHTVLWLPFILYLLLRYLKKPSIRLPIVVIFILAVVIFAGYIQLALYVFLTSFSYFIWQLFATERRRSLKKYMPMIMAFLSAPFLAAVQLLPLAEVFIISSRSAYTPEQLLERLIPLQNLITLIAPDFFGNPATRSYWLPGTYIERAAYIGIIPLLFALFAVYKRQHKITLFFAVVAVITYISTLNIYPTQLLHGLGIPILSTTVPSRILSIFCFSLAVLSGIGLDTWLRMKNKREIFYPVIFLAAVLVFAWGFVLMQTDPRFDVSKRNLLLPTAFMIGGAFLLFLKDKVPKTWVVAGIFIIVIADLFYFFHKITPFAPIDFLYPKTSIAEKLRSLQGYYRSWGYGSGFIDANLPIMEGMYATDGYEPLFSKRYAEFIAASKDGTIQSTITRSDVNLSPGYGIEGIRNNESRQKIMDIVGVKYVLHASSSENPDYATFPPELYRLIAREASWHIYENLQVFPRTYLASKVVVEKDKQKIIDKLLSDDFTSQEVVVMEGNPGFTSHAPDPAASSHIVSYSPNSIIITTQSEKSAVLVLSDTFFPGWNVSIDHENAKIYRANYTFRAVKIPEGEHTVIFEYKPLSFTIGIIVSIGTLFILMIVFLRTTFRNKYV